jgi:CMP-N,N'-diacetyllegionaminic acid synthase
MASKTNNKVYAIIPARGGSKGIPNKNIINLAGFPLIAYSIAAAKRCPHIDRIIVSTDSKEIGQLAVKYGAEVPFMRPEQLAGDKSPDREFVVHCLDWFLENEGQEPEYLVHLRPTTPLRLPEIISSAIINIKQNQNATSLRSAHELPEPPQKMMGVNDGYLTGLFPHYTDLEYYNLPRQAFPTAYQPNGYVDVLNTTFVRSSDGLYGPNIMAVITERSFELDLAEDLIWLKYVIEQQEHVLLNYLTTHFQN